MAVSLGRKVILDTNVFVDYLRAELHADWVFGRLGDHIRFLSSIVLMELRLGADTFARRRAIDRIKAAFPSERVIAPASELFDRAGQLFRILYGSRSGHADRLGPMNDLLIALTARQIGAAVVTSNLNDFQRIANRLPGLIIVPPDHGRLEK
jgi:predicted nucleic acid-binding protein